MQSLSSSEQTIASANNNLAMMLQRPTVCGAMLSVKEKNFIVEM